MSKDILSLISSKMNTFSKGQKLIANYILSSYDKAAFMTASKLGKTVHVRGALCLGAEVRRVSRHAEGPARNDSE